jgi:Tfp pilus assembly protein PilX
MLAASFPARPAPLRRQRGSILITALIFAAAIAIVIASILPLARNSRRLSNRLFYDFAAQDLAESGLEQGMWAINASYAGNSSAWSSWTTDTNNAWRKFSNFSYSGGNTGSVNVCVAGYAGSNPVVVAKAVITLQDGQSVEKWVKVTVKTRSLFAYGLLARNHITMSGGASFDSWKSDPDNDSSTAPVAYSSSVALDNAGVASSSTDTPAISIGSADIYGKVAVGATSSAGLAMSWGGQVGPHGMPISGSYNVAANALSTDFKANFETVTAPTGATVMSPYVLPRSVSGPPYYLSTESFGAAGATTILQMDSISISGAATLTIQGDVTIILPPSATTTIGISGSGRIALASGASLKIYTPGSINISGAGIANSGAPQSLQIWSTTNGASGQTISLSGSGAYSGIIYAPDAALSSSGGTNYYGAAIVGSATFSGSGAFHYDESLKNYGSSGSIGIDSYSELNTPADRSPYSSQLNF